MSLRPLFATTAFAVLPLLSAHAADTPPPPKPPEALVDVAGAFGAVMKDWQVAGADQRNMARHLEQLASFQHSPATSAKLRKVFGSERPWSLERAQAPKGQIVYRSLLAPASYDGADGSRFEWTALATTLKTNQAGNRLEVLGAWPSFNAAFNDVRVSARGMRLISKQKRGSGDLWFGDAAFDIGSVQIASATPGAGDTTMNALRFYTSVLERAAGVAVGYGVTIKSIELAGERVDLLKLDARISNIDKAAMIVMTRALQKNGEGEGPEHDAAMLEVLKDFARKSIARGTAIELRELSARYAGHVASLKGRIGVQGASQADLQSLDAVGKKIVARFEAKVPVALVRAVAESVVRKQMSAAGTVPTDAEVKKASQSIVDVVLGKMLGNGYARLEKGMLLSTIDVRGGVMRVNGKYVQLPTQQPDTPVQQGGARGAIIMPPRQVSGSCTMPQFTGQRRDGAAGTVSVRFIVSAEGKVTQLETVQASGYPEFDKSLRDALESCTYIPALATDRPVAMPVTHSVTLF